MQIRFRTDVGQKRKDNQDAVGIFKNKENIPFAVVADGMGGHQAGDVASNMAIQDLGKLWESSSLTRQEDIVQWLLCSIQAENEVIYKKGEADVTLKGMGTTIVAVILLKRTLLLAHVGDSRGYLLRNNQLKKLTEDHSLVNELVKSGEITAEMAEHHPQKNVLVRSVGMPGDVDVDVTELDFLEHDLLILCTDGLTNMVSEQEMQTILQKESLSITEKLDQLVANANQAGGTDNITVLLAEHGGTKEETQ